MIQRGPGRPDDGYIATNGQEVPSVTTILGRWKDTSGLMPWSAGRGGVAVWEAISNGRALTESEAYRIGKAGPEKIKERAADIGSSAHDMIEEAIYRAVAGESFVSVFDGALNQIEEELARRAFWAWARWWDSVSHELEIVATEVPLVHERLRFGGTFDALARNIKHGWLEVLDWKTSSGIYAEYVYQMGGYAMLIEQEHGEKPQQARIVQVNKHTTGQVEPHGQGWRASITIGSKLRTKDFDGQHAAELWLQRTRDRAGVANVLCLGDEPDGKFPGHLTLAAQQFRRLRAASFYEERIKASLKLR